MRGACWEAFVIIFGSPHSHYMCGRCLTPLSRHVRTGEIDPALLSQRHLALQKLRAKTKKAVDRRASKGRKVRYACGSVNGGPEGDGKGHPVVWNLRVSVTLTDWLRVVCVSVCVGVRLCRYNVHEKLVNFMPPVETETMASDIRDDLFANLFGNNALSIGLR